MFTVDSWMIWFGRLWASIYFFSIYYFFIFRKWWLFKITKPRKANHQALLQILRSVCTVVVGAFLSWTLRVTQYVLWPTPVHEHVQVQVQSIGWEDLRVQTFSVTPPCRQQHSVFGGSMCTHLMYLSPSIFLSTSWTVSFIYKAWHLISQYFYF